MALASAAVPSHTMASELNSMGARLVSTHARSIENHIFSAS
jgi:hypothetical protein